MLLSAFSKYTLYECDSSSVKISYSSLSRKLELANLIKSLIGCDRIRHRRSASDIESSSSQKAGTGAMPAHSINSNIAPFDLPFEHPSGVGLNFNFWTRRTYLETEKDVCDLLTGLLVGDELDCIKVQSNKSNHPVKIILAVAQGADSTVMTAENISTSLFFSKCSSVPINQQQRSEIASKVSRAQPTDTIYNSLLWPEKPPCSLENMKHIHSAKLFKDFALKFQATHTDWQDSLIFNCGKNAEDAGQFENLLQQKKEAGQLSQVNSVMNSMSAKKTTESDIYGYFRRTKVADSGLFMFRSNEDDSSGSLIIAWFKSGIRRLDLMPCYGSQNRSDSNSSNTTHGEGEGEGDAEEEDAFLQMEKELLNEKKKENGDDVTESNAEEKKEKTKYNNSDDVEKKITKRNGGLEFSLCLDQSSTVDLYLELVSGVEKEEKFENLENSTILSLSESNKNNSIQCTEKKCEKINENKKTKFGILDEGKEENMSKKQKAHNHKGTHTIFLAAENKKEHSSDDVALLKEQKANLLNNISEIFETESNENDSKFLDSAAHKRLSVLYEKCSGQLLDSLVLSEGMLRLMGYPGCDGEEVPNFISTDSSMWVPKPILQYKKISESKMKEEGEEEEGEEGEGEEGEVGEEKENEKKIEDLSCSMDVDLGPQEPLVVCGVDCEMCYTDQGLELTRVTVVCPQKGVVLDSLVRPSRPVTDYNTAYSGITKEILDGVSTTMADVHNMLRRIISPHTILVGHSLDCDMRSLHIIHRRVVDTAALFPHPRGAPYKLALKKLALDYLDRVVQADSGSTGHDSIQDAAVALELALLKAQLGHESLGQPVVWGASDVPRYSLFQHIHRAVLESSTKNSANPIKKKLLECSFSVHGCRILTQSPSWERGAFTFQDEADSCFAVKHFEAQQNTVKASLQKKDEKNFNLINCNFCKYDRSILAINGAIAELEKIKCSNSEKSDKKGAKLNKKKNEGKNESASQATFTWVDLNFSENLNLIHAGEYGNGNMNGTGTMAGDGSDSDSDREETSPSFAAFSSFSLGDRALNDLYLVSEPGTIMLVLTQADILPLVHLMAKKQRYRWEVQAAKQSTTAKFTVTWTDWEERELQKEMTLVRSGAMFVRTKDCN